jgi:hypothetical protein
MLNGSLERPLPTSDWIAPKRVEIDGGRLRYSVGPYNEQQFRKPSTGMLEAFARLTKARPSQIAQYAKRWGMLALRFVPGHSQDCKRWVHNKEHCWDVAGVESLRVWRYWAERVSAVLRVMSSIQNGGLGDRKDWRTVMGPHYPPGGYDPERSPHCPSYDDALFDRRFALCFTLDDWMDIGGIRLYLNPYENRVEINTPSLFSGLVIQLISVVYQSNGIAICSACGQPFAPKRAPAREKRHYCDQCRSLGRPVRDAVRAHRGRSRGNENHV